MWDRLRNVWLPRFCFAIAFALSLALAGAVVVAPLLVPEEGPPPLLELFAQDLTVRRTALASAGCLFVTACVFFRPAIAPSKKSSPKGPPPGNMAGA
jgi:hypothetical protein